MGPGHSLAASSNGVLYGWGGSEHTPTVISVPGDVTVAQVAAGPNCNFALTTSAGGNTVTIQGTGFARGAVVAFGTHIASSVSVSSSKLLTVTAPAGTGTVDVMVTVEGSTSPVTNADRYTFEIAGSAPVPAGGPGEPGSPGGRVIALPPAGWIGHQVQPAWVLSRYDASMRAPRLAIAFLIVACISATAQAAAASKLHIRAGGYAQSAKETTKEGYSNGGVNLIVSSNRKTITVAGVSCYTGSAPSGGLPANDEVSIRVPRPLTISRAGSFSFSGPVTLTPEESQTEQTFTTTYTIKGRFQNGKIAVLGTDSSPICQPATFTSFRLHYDPLA